MEGEIQREAYYGVTGVLREKERERRRKRRESENLLLGMLCVQISVCFYAV